MAASVSRADERLEGEVGQALGQQALGRAHEEDRLLELAPAADEPDLLAAVLGVVAGVGLVGDEVAERRATSTGRSTLMATRLRRSPR